MRRNSIEKEEKEAQPTPKQSEVWSSCWGIPETWEVWLLWNVVGSWEQVVITQEDKYSLKPTHGEMTKLLHNGEHVW